LLEFYRECRLENYWEAWIYDNDYPTMFISACRCSKHNNYASFKEDFLMGIDDAIKSARDFMDGKNIDESAKESRPTKCMIEAMEAFADNPSPSDKK